jgi:hypothetical protein
MDLLGKKPAIAKPSGAAPWLGTPKPAVVGFRPSTQPTATRSHFKAIYNERLSWIYGGSVT